MHDDNDNDNDEEEEEVVSRDTHVTLVTDVQGNVDMSSRGPAHQPPPPPPPPERAQHL